ncbi:uncharacterized protein LOC121519615 isoform X2 [Cheilinus undulatus]|uniref:uncharacterized protein LOC121519615 isoform X2 n=1 Tax=Cheilinus undulatus TaxID=241271 RepID=UPI001BD2B356|nr:uncharacterized protein LOC121519615 isoform X2 [Cheilinus undulatus]
MCKMNSGRLSSLPEKKPDASTEDEEFDLHKWISGFSFEVGDQTENYYSQGKRSCNRYQEKLKSKALKESQEFWMKDKNLFQEAYRPNLSYTPLVLDTQGEASASKIRKFKNRKGKLSWPKKLGTYLPEDDLGISPRELLKTQRDILIVGKPGIGKTALSHEILKLWAERDSSELEYMFYFDIRETSHIRDGISLEELLFDEYCEPDEDKEKVSEDIKKYSDNVTIIFDGITDLSSSVVRKIVDGDLLPYAKVIITCRPDDEKEFLSGNFLRVEVKGFSEQTIEKYFSTMLGVDQNKVFSKVELLTLCHVPLYALMVAACFLSETPEDSSQPCSMTEIYINIVRHCLQLNSKTNKKHLNSFIKEKRAELLSLAEAAFHATERKTVSLTDLQCDDSCVLSFLKPLFVQVAPTETTTLYFFLHYTVQEFFAAVWLLKNPDQIKIVFQQCLTEEGKHMKHLIPFMCRLLTKKSPSLMEYLIPVEELNNISDWFFKEMMITFFSAQSMNDEADTEDTGLDESVLFLCQCLFESQSSEACTSFLETLDYKLDLSGEILDSYLCCAVAYVVTQSKERKIQLNLEDVSVSEQGMRQLYGCLNNVHWCDPLPRQLWEMVLLSEGQLSNVDLLSLDGNQMHLPVRGKRQLFKRAVSVMKNIPKKINVCLHWDNGATTVSQSLCEALLEALPIVESLSFRMTHNSPGLEDQESDPRTLERKKKKLLLDLCLKAALDEDQSFHHVVHQLVSMFSVDKHLHNFFVDFYEHVKNKGCSSVRPKLDPLFKSTSEVWSINLSEIDTSTLLEALKLLKKTEVNLTGYSDEESGVRSFLQCLPYISHLSFSGRSDSEVKFCGSLFCAAATTERELQSGENTLELLSSVCRHQTFPFIEFYYSKYKYTQCEFFLDVYSHVKNYETKTGLSVLQPLQSFFTSDQTVWSVDLSKRKTSILVEVLKLQTEKIHVELRECSDEESEVRNFLHCLPYISKLSFSRWSDSGVKFCGSLFCAAATTERELQSGENTLELLSSVCRHQTFPFNPNVASYQSWQIQCDFFLDLCSHIKNYETKTGLSVLPPLQSLFTSDLTVWSVDLSERKTSILLETLKLQTEKIHVELRGWSDEESEVRNFLHCLPYISKLSFSGRSDSEVKFCGSLFCAAATTERELQSGENTLELLSSVCRHQTFPFTEFYYSKHKYTQCEFFLDVYSHIQNYESKIGLSVLQPLQSLFTSDQTVWSVDLSKRKTSILLEALKLQTEKIHVELRGWSDEESEVRNFLHCLPYISKLSFCGLSDSGVKFCGSLFCAAATTERELQSGENTLELLSSVCRHQTFPFTEENSKYKYSQCDFFLDLCSHIKNYETKIGLSVLQPLQSFFTSDQTVWSVDLSKRKTSILLGVLKLQTEKIHVELRGWSDEESEVRNFLHCLPYISKLSFPGWSDSEVKFCGSLFCAAATTERELQSGENTLELLSSVCRHQTFPFTEENSKYKSSQCDVFLDLYSHIKNYETKIGLSVLQPLQSFFTSDQTVWSVDLSERKTSILLGVLKLQTEKIHVELRGWSDEESEVRNFLHCLPYISKLSFPGWSDSGGKFCGSLFCAAATTERELQSGENTLELLSSVCRHQTFPFTEENSKYKSSQCDVFLDLYSHIKNYETKIGLSVLQPLQSFFTSDQTVWSVDLSERKTSILLGVLKLQTEKIHVELRGWSDEESEVRNFLHCLPYISKLSFSGRRDSGVKFCGSLFCAAATTERELQSGENTLELLSSVCRHQTFPFIYNHYKSSQCDFFLDLCSHIKNYETKTGLSVLQPLQSLFTSDQTVWSVDLSKRKTSILLEVLKLQTEKIHVELRGWSDEESEVRNFLHCLPYISKLSFSGRRDSGVKFCGSLFCAAATTERELQSGENTLELLSSVCTYETFTFIDNHYKSSQCDFFLDLCSHIKNYETNTGLSVLQPLQSFFTSDQTVWSVDLSKRKTSILLEVLKLQTEKIHVELRGWSDEESEVRNFLHCLPYISKLSFSGWRDSEVKFCGSLFCAAATTERELQSGENTLELLSSVCRHQTFPFINDYEYTECDFFLDLCSHIKNYETKTGLSVLQPLQSFFTSDQTVWSVDLSKRKTSILLEVLKLQTEKIHVELRGWSDEESEVRNFLHCLPYISKLSFSGWSFSGVKFCGSLFCAAATTERELQSGENTLELLSSVCRHQTFPFTDDDYVDDDYEYTQCDFFLDLCSHIKNYETKTGLSVLQPLQSFFTSVRTVWYVDLSERKTSILLEVLKLQTEKIHVELTEWSDEESVVRNFLHCLPYISKLGCYDQEFFQDVCTSISVRSRDETEQLVHLLQLLGFTLHLSGKLTSKTCKTVGRVLGLCGSDVDLNLTPRVMSVRGASLLFRHVKTLHSLRLSNSMALLLSGWVRRQEVPCLTVTEQLSLAPQSGPSSERVSLRVVSSLASLLRYWTIRQLDLTESSIPAQSLSSLLLHGGPLKIKLHESFFQQLLNLLSETQDDDLILAFLRKVNGDLTPFSLNWELLHRLLQLSSQTLTVNLRKNRFLQRSITPLLPFLDRIVFKRPFPRFVLTTIREIYATRSSSVVPSFLRSFDHVINLTCREMDSDDCAALRFTLNRCDGVKLNLLWTSIPTEEIRPILCALDRVSQLSVDRNLLLKLVHCCAASGDLLTTADSLLRALQHRLDLSRSSCAELSEEGQSETLRLTVADCKAVSTVLTRSSSWDRTTELHLQDCEVEDSGLDLLFSVLDRVRLRASKVILLQLVALIPLDSMRRAEYLCKALDGELDLSDTELDQGACQALACMLEFSEGLKELDLSHCQLTDQLLHTIKDHLHKVQVLDLSHNKITDASTYTLLGLISNNSSIETVRLFRNNIKHQTFLKTVKKFEIW